jgi:hypothetical protein
MTARILGVHGGLTGQEALAFLASSAGTAFYESVGRLPDEERPLVALRLPQEKVWAVFAEESFRICGPGLVYGTNTCAGRYDRTAVRVDTFGNFDVAYKARCSGRGAVACAAALVVWGARVLRR